MANWFVDSVQGAGGLGDGTSWANAYLTLAAALSAKAAGDTFWVGDDHAETQAAAMTLTSPGTVSNPCFVYCVDHTKASPGSGDLKTTATITTTGNFALTTAGSAYFYGITFNAGSGANNAKLLAGQTTGCRQVYDTCSLRKLGTTGISGAITLGGSQAAITLINTTVQFGSTSDTIAPPIGGGVLKWKATPAAIAGSVFPVTLIAGSSPNYVYLEGVDLSALGAGVTIIGGNSAFPAYLKDCLYGSAVTVAGTPAATVTGSEFYNIRSDSSGTNYRCEKYAYTGTETTETTITRVGGASDGTTAQSRKLVSTANSKWVLPFEALPIALWVDDTNPHTVTLEGTWNSASVPNTDDIWLEAEYLGSAASPLGSFATQTKANNLATGVALPSSTATWNGGGSGAGWSPFKLTVSFTPAMKGPVTLVVKAAKASSTFYIDPLVILT